MRSWHNLRRPHQLTKNASVPCRLVAVLFPKALRPAALCFTMGMGTWLFACGPHFPSWLLSEGDQAFLRAPWIRLKSEMRALIGGKPSPYKAVEARKDRPFTGNRQLCPIQLRLPCGSKGRI